MTSPNRSPETKARVAAVVCTHNRPAEVARAVQSLREQTLKGEEYEIIVVDSASTDSTSQVVAALSTAGGEQLRVLRTSEPGISKARNAAICDARSQFIAFLDDDAVATEDWLERVVALFDARPQVVAFGGPILPLWECEKPRWFKDEYEIRSWGPVARPLEPWEAFAGSNMAFRRDVLEEIGGFEQGLGPKGSRTLALGEDTALFEKLWRRGLQRGDVWYDPELIVLHSVPRYKMAVGYGLRRALAAGQSWAARHCPTGFLARSAVGARLCARIALGLGAAALRRRRYSCWQNWLWEAAAPVGESVGRLLGCFSIRVALSQRGKDER